MIESIGTEPREIDLGNDLWKYALLTMVQRPNMEISKSDLIGELPKYIVSVHKPNLEQSPKTASLSHVLAELRNFYHRRRASLDWNNWPNKSERHRFLHSSYSFSPENIVRIGTLGVLAFFIWYDPVQTLVRLYSESIGSRLAGMVAVDCT